MNKFLDVVELTKLSQEEINHLNSFQNKTRAGKKKDNYRSTSLINRGSKNSQ
jgi:hypothetical protein